MNQTSIFQILLKKQAHNKQAATELFYYTTYKTAAVEPISKTKNPGMANDKSPPISSMMTAVIATIFTTHDNKHGN